MKLSSSLLLTLALTVGLHAQVNWLGSAQRKSVRIVHQTEPVFPLNLMQQGVQKGYATIMFSVSDVGKVEDRIVSAYSHKEFADAALAVLKDWVYIPASINGEPMGVVTQVHFTFEAGQVVIQMNGVEASMLFVNRLIQPEGYRLSTLAEIDRIPVPRLVEAPRYTDAHVKKGQCGKVVFEFIIDETGRVRLPCAVSGDDPELTDLAGVALGAWQFEPPLRQGQPVAVRARQVFNFDPKAVKPAAKL